MALLQLRFASKGTFLSVRNFEVHEALSKPFEAIIIACSERPDIDLETIVAHEASFFIASDQDLALSHGRHWKGICKRIEQIQAEPTGLSTYRIHIVPTLWLLTQWRNHRIFQHLSIPEIIKNLFLERGIQAVFRFDVQRYPKLEYRVQYGETDFDFVHRLLEEAGISYFFENSGDIDDDWAKMSQLVLTDCPQTATPWTLSPIPFVDNPNRSNGRPYATKVVLTHEVRPGKYTVRDFDFRGRLKFRLFAEAAIPDGPESSYEQYHYVPGAFVDDKSPSSLNEQLRTTVAEVGLESLQTSKRQVVFQTNSVELAAGFVFAIEYHPHPELEPNKHLLITEMNLQGEHDKEWTIEGRAVSVEQAYRPPRITPKSRIFGVQSALVVGPKGSKIHTDPHGRVRIQFHWDREGKHNEHSSCWVRVSQGWAGKRFGLVAIPRIGQEVLVGFFEGDPDQPIIVGRVFNTESPLPYDLPANQTVSTWKSHSSRDADSHESGGYNEIKFEDALGQEQVYIQAERELVKLVKEDELEKTGRNRTITVGSNRTTTVSAVDEANVGQRYTVSMMTAAGNAKTAIQMVDGRIELTTGEASIILEGPNITLAAKGIITVKSSDNDVVIQGGPWVKINCGAEGETVSDTVTMHHLTGILRDQDEMPLAGRKVVVTASDGSVQEAETDSTGRYFAVVPPGQCKVSLPGPHRYGTKGPHFDDMTTEPEFLDDCGPIQ